MTAYDHVLHVKSDEKNDTGTPVGVDLPRYSVGEEKSLYFLFHGETALHKILKFQGETPNFSKKFQGEIAEFLRENMELYR